MFKKIHGETCMYYVCISRCTSSKQTVSLGLHFDSFFSFNMYETVCLMLMDEKMQHIIGRS